MSTARNSAALALTFVLCWSATSPAQTPQYWVQIAAAANEAKANARLSEIVQRNMTVRQANEAGRILVYKQEDKRGDFWRVRIGPFESHEQAREYCGRLRNEGQSCLAVR